MSLYSIITLPDSFKSLHGRECMAIFEPNGDEITVTGAIIYGYKNGSMVVNYEYSVKPEKSYGAKLLELLNDMQEKIISTYQKKREA